MTLKSNKNEILWNLINSLLAGGLVLLGSFSSGQFTAQGFILALVAGVAVAMAKFKDYWISQEAEYRNHLFSFVG